MNSKNRKSFFFLSKYNCKKIFYIFILLILSVMLMWVLSVWVRIYDNPREEDTPQENGRDGITNIMVLGVDEAQGDEDQNIDPLLSVRADTIMIMSINNDTEDAALVSIPRDSRVDIPGYGLDKINHAMQFGGVALLRRTVERSLEISVDHYIYTNFTGFKHIIDALGGIEIDSELQIIGLDGNPIINAGPQHINGRQALTYVRFRSDFEGDFGRMRRQQQVLKAMIRQTKKMESLRRFPMLLEQLARYVRTDMMPAQLLSFSRLAGTLDFSRLSAVRLKGDVATIDGISYVLLDEPFLRDTVRRYIHWNKPVK